jgi:predicted GNAT family N-acyltransferase
MIFVKKIDNAIDLQSAMRIRQRVFVDEQKVPPYEEYDKHEGISNHFLAIDSRTTPCGTARWRFTEEGIKLERFAVDLNYRNLGVGSALMQSMLEDIRKHPQSQGKKLYLHAQVTATPLYEKFGFTIVGDIFVEANLEHYKMERFPS